MSDQMTRQQWLAEVCRRIGINEGCRTTMYRDSKDIPTIGVGFNLMRGDAEHAIHLCGVQDFAGVMAGTVALSQSQIQTLFEYSFAPIEDQARKSLSTGVFDALTDARRFVICDLVFNMGEEGWLEFAGTRTLLDEAQAAKNAGNVDNAHSLFNTAGDHLEDSAWYSQVGDRAKRNVAMIRSGEWVNAEGDGTS